MYIYIVENSSDRRRQKTQSPDETVPSPLPYSRARHGPRAADVVPRGGDKAPAVRATTTVHDVLRALL